MPTEKRNNFSDKCWFGCSKCLDCIYCRVDEKYSTICRKGKKSGDKPTLAELIFGRKKK